MLVRIHNGLCAVAAAIAAVGALAASSSDAWAGRFHVYSCRTPNGEAAPSNGWSGSKTGSYSYAESTCESGGALVAALRDHAPRTANTDIATWTFAPGTLESLAGATLWRAGDAAGGQAAFAVYGFWFAGPEDQNTPGYAFGQCFNGPSCRSGVGNPGEPLSPTNRVTVAPANLYGHLYVNATCSGEAGYPCPEGEHDSNGYAAVVYLYAADLTLEQTAGPTAGAPGGELASAATVSGTSDITFTASDPGAGVYTAVFSVDGQVLQSTVIDENGGRCRNVGQTSDGLPAFLYVQPCKTSLTADVGLDTTRIANGTHHLIVSVVDAAGNSAPALDRNMTVANPTSGASAPPGSSAPSQSSGQAGGTPSSPSGAAAGTAGAPNGTPASAHAGLALAWAGTRGLRLTLPYGRPATAVGRLTGPAGTPIAGAQLSVEALPSYAGATAVPLPSATTGADGRFRVGLAGGVSSRTLRISYRQHIGDPAPVAGGVLTLVVRAGVSLLVAPRTTSVGRTIRFQGVLRGGPIPRGGKQVVLEARSPGGSWLEFNVVRANASGRYRATYRFRFPGPATYQFRAVSETESDYPFAAATSNTVLVRER
jgi:hypothetical protein